MQKVAAIILAGGFGTRLREAVADVPKPLASVGGRPFLDLLLGQLAAGGCISRAVLAIGHRSDLVIAAYRGRSEFGFPIDFSVEREPLGTGGAIRLALAKTDSPLVLALNGDSFVDIDLRALLSAHRRHGGGMTMVLHKAEDASRYGSVNVDERGRVVAFSEKSSSRQGGLINAGVYVFRRELFAEVPEHRALSLERDLLQRFLAAGVFGFISTGRFIDIGTPESYARAAGYLAGR